jgi:hypothetical protein
MLKYEDFPQHIFQPKGFRAVEARAADARSTVLFSGAVGQEEGVAILDAIKSAVSG